MGGGGYSPLWIRCSFSTHDDCSNSPVHRDINLVDEELVVVRVIDWVLRLEAIEHLLVREAVEDRRCDHQEAVEEQEGWARLVLGARHI